MFKRCQGIGERKRKRERKNEGIEYSPYSTTAEPKVNGKVTTKSKMNIDATQDNIMEIEVAKPLRMLSAYLIYLQKCLYQYSSSNHFSEMNISKSGEVLT